MIINMILLLVLTMGAIFFYIGDDIGSDFTNIITLIAAIVIMLLSFGIVIFYINKMKTNKQSGELKDDSWDGIKEYKNDVPIGWGLSFVAVAIFVVYYLFVGYPTWSFSQIGQWNNEVKDHKVKYEAKYKNISKDDLFKMGKSIFLVQCAGCHGITADGMGGKAQNLVYWSSEEHIINVIQNGTKGIKDPAYSAMGGMPAMSHLTADQARAIAAYIKQDFMPADTQNKNLVTKGKELYNGIGTCAGCHGANGEGYTGVAPSLKTLVNEVMSKGKAGSIGEMPNFNAMLPSKVQRQALSEYIYNLENE